MQGRLAAAWLGSVLALALAACVGSAQSATPTVQPVAETPTVPATPVPTFTPVPPTPTLAPTFTPVPPTPTPVVPLPLQINAQLDPPTPHAGEEFVLALSVTNNGARAARGIFIATSGPWDRWTVLGIEPTGTFSGDVAGWRIVSAEEVPAGETRTILVHVRADAPSQDQLTFAVREAEPGELSSAPGPDRRSW